MGYLNCIGVICTDITGTTDRSQYWLLFVIVITAKLPKWFGERPGKKPGEPESPDDEDEGQADAPPGAADEEEEEEEEEEEDE